MSSAKARKPEAAPFSDNPFASSPGAANGVNGAHSPGHQETLEVSLPELGSQGLWAS